MKQSLFLSFILSILGFCTACSSDEPLIGNIEKQEIKLDARSRAICETLSDFYVRFTTDVVESVDNKEGKATNVVSSPLSASMVLGMIANGVDDINSQKIYTYLGINDIDGLNNLSSSLSNELPLADKKSIFSLANSFWYNSNRNLNDRFKSVLKQYYNPDFQLFSPGDSDNTTKKINSWIERNSGGLIRDFNDFISPATEVILLNTIYFNSIWWKELFKEEKTYSGIFHGANGDTTVEIMKSSECTLEVSSTEHFNSVKLPFGNGAFNLTIILPRDDLSINQVSGLLNYEQIKKLNERSYKNSVILELPKFKISSNLDLHDILELCGLKSLEPSNITMFDKELTDTQILEFRQGVSFQIDEKGVESASVSQVGLTTGASIGYKPDVLTIDRPFYFFINEYSTGVCLLSGRIADL